MGKASELKNKTGNKNRTMEQLTREVEELRQKVLELTAELKEARNNSAEDQARFFRLLDSLPVFAYLQRPDHTIRYANRHFIDIYGTPGDKPCHEVIWHKSEPCDPCPTFRVFETKKTEIWESRHPDGSSFKVFDIPFTDTDGSPLVLEISLDRTDVSRSEEARKTCDEKYKTLVDTMPYGIKECDTSGIITFSNPAHARLLGYEEDELVGKAVWDFCDTGQEREELRQYLERRVKEQPPPVPFFTKNKTKDGRLIDVRVDWDYERNDSGELTGFISVITDITEQKRAEEATAAKLHYTRSMSKINKSMEKVQSLESMLTSTLNEILSVFGCNRAWLLYPVDLEADSFRVPYQVWTPDYPVPVDGIVEIPVKGDDTALDVYKKALASKEPLTFIFDVAKLPKGTVFTKMVEDFQIRSQMIITIHPKVGKPWLLGIHQCSHARVWTEDEQRLFKDISVRITDAVTGMLLYKDLETSEKKFRSIFESSNDAIMLLADGAFFDCNKATLKIFGCSNMDEFIGRHPGYWSPPTQPNGRDSIELANERIAEAIRDGRNFFEWTHRRANGEDFPAEVLLTPMQLEGKNVMQATVRDITERKRAVEEKEQLNAQLVQAQKMEAVGTMAGGIAHDFNNIMIVIKNLTSLALNKLAEDDAINRYLDPIKEVSERGINLVQQLLIFSQHKPVEFSYFNLNDLIEDFSKIIDTIVSEDISINRDLEHGLWDIKAEKGRIEQLITNLIINSRDAMLMGGVITLRTENVTLTDSKASLIQGARPGNFVCLTIQDTGAGMDKDTLEHIFEPFFTTKSPMGTGLGLSVVYGVVKELNGWINVSSKPGRGAKFMVYLPISTGHSKAAPEERIEAIPFNGGGRRILLVEDDKWVRKSTAMVLTENGYVVYEASSAEQAISLFYKEKGRFDLVMSDVVMPGKNGLQLVGPLLDINPSVSILLCSGHLDDKVQLDQIVKRGLPYIQKPYEINDLLRAIDEVIKEGSNGRKR